MEKIFKFTVEENVNDLEKIKRFEFVRDFGTPEQYKEMKNLYRLYSKAMSNAGIDLFVKFFLIYPKNFSAESLCKELKWNQNDLEKVKTEIINFLYVELNNDKKAVA